MTSLDTFAELLARWQEADRPTDRFAVVTQAASDLRDLSATDARALAQGLLEHGAPLAAAQVASQAGHGGSAEELTDVAQALLALDPGELGRFAEELRDPQARERLLEHAAAQVTDGDDDLTAVDAALPPPDRASRHDGTPPEPPPGPSATSATDPAPGDEPGHPSAEAAPDGADDEVELAAEVTPEPVPSELAEPVEPSRPVPERWREPPVPADVQDLGQALAAARTPQDRWRLLQDAGLPSLDAHGLGHVLERVPDGWQRRTLLRRLLDADRIATLAEPGEVVSRFARDGDRFAVAAWLVGAGLAGPDDLVDLLRERGARRLRRRAA